MTCHRKRQSQILAVHPELRNLQGPEWKSKWIALFLVGSQIALAIRSVTWSWGLQYFVLLYACGATLSQALFLANHELAHGLFFHTPAYNRAFSLIVNWPALVPYAASFRAYHLEHHAHQGKEGVDTDLPTEWEMKHVRGGMRKAMWLSLQLVFYAGRPVVVRPRPIGMAEFINAMSQLAFVTTMWSVWGPGVITYFFLSTLLSGGVHPCAGHFLSEHYMLHAPEKASDPEAHDTFSYYGGLNTLTWRVGFHNEHHDFPRVPWSRLPAIRHAAPEFYKDLPTCSSWTHALFRFVMDPHIDLRARVRTKELKDA